MFKSIHYRIHEIQGRRVMLDFDLVELYKAMQNQSKY
jgi:hypothetical protein